MASLAIAGNPRFEIDAAEVEADQPSFTVPTLERLRASAACGAHRPLVLLTGADAFAGMAAWHQWQRLFDLAHVAVACRPGYSVQAENLPAQHWLVFRQRCTTIMRNWQPRSGRSIVSFAMTPLGISATRIRDILSKKGKSALSVAGRYSRLHLPTFTVPGDLTFI